MTSPEGEGAGTVPRRRLVDVLFAGIVAGSVAYWYRATGSVWFNADEWMMANQVRDGEGILRPYNRHLSIIMLSIYRALLELFGFSTHGPYRLVGLVCFASVAVALYLTTRRRLGPVLAATVSLVFLWPRDISLEPGGLNHSLALTGGIVCAWGLVGRGRRRDAVVFGGLAFALGAAGGGVAVAGAAIVHSLCTRASMRRWAAVLTPVVAWAIWWRLAVPPEVGTMVDDRPRATVLLWDAADHARQSFAYLALGNRLVGLLLSLAFVALGCWRLRGGVSAAANFIGWSAALAFWWVGLEWSRWALMNERTFRYDFLSVGFIVLACLPVRDAPTAVARIGWRPAPWRVDLVGPVLVGAIAGVLAWSVQPDVARFDLGFRGPSRTTRSQVAVAGLPGQVPSDHVVRLGLVSLTAGQLRGLFGQFAPPPEWGDVERTVDLGGSVEPVEPAAGPDQATRCLALGDAWRAPPDVDVRVHAGASRSSVVEVRRFGSDWVPIGAIEPNGAAVVHLVGFGLAEPWQLRVAGACRPVG